jgi:hypothetical protein
MTRNISNPLNNLQNKIFLYKKCLLRNKKMISFIDATNKLNQEKDLFIFIFEI